MKLSALGRILSEYQFLIHVAAGINIPYINSRLVAENFLALGLMDSVLSAQNKSNPDTPNYLPHSGVGGVSGPDICLHSTCVKKYMCFTCSPCKCISVIAVDVHRCGLCVASEHSNPAHVLNHCGKTIHYVSRVNRSI